MGFYFWAMANSEFDILLDSIINGRLSPVYFFQGEEPYFIDSLMTAIEKHALAEHEKEFNQNIIYGKDVSLLQVLEMARRYPLMAARQTILVKEAQEMADLAKKDSQMLLVKYLQNPVSSTVLAFAYKGKKIDAKTTLAKELKSKAILFESKKLYDNQLPDWVKSYCRSKGLLVEEHAVFWLIEMIGNDIQRITNEIHKLTIGYDLSKPLTVDWVRKKIAQTREYGVFDLQNAIAKRDIPKANQIVNYFISNPKENPLVVIIVSLYGFVSKLVQTHTYKALPQAELAQKLKVHPFFVRDYLSAAKNYSITQLIAALHALHEADLLSKGIGGMDDDELILKRLVYKIMH